MKAVAAGGIRDVREILSVEIAAAEIGRLARQSPRKDCRKEVSEKPSTNYQSPLPQFWLQFSIPSERATPPWRGFKLG